MTDGTVLARRDRALTPDETERYLRDRLPEGVDRGVQEYGVFTLWLTQDAWFEAARLCRDEPLLAYDMFDCLFGIDARDDGFDVVSVLYSTSTGNRIALRTRCAGGREQPTCPSLTELYRGADWMEREAYDMFGIDFPGHPGVEPRLLSVENFEGWPLRKDFPLSSRAVKPWPGVKEPAELDEDGNVIEREPRLGDAPGPYELDKALGEQARARNAVRDTYDDVDGSTVGAEVGETSPADAAELAVGQDAAPEQAAARADERRRAQADARARKAAERAGTDVGETPGPGDEPEDDA